MNDSTGLIEIHNEGEVPASLKQMWEERGRITERVDADTHIPPKYLTITPPAPKAVKIELTGRCDLACTFCALTTREVQPKKANDMPFWLFKKIVDDMAAEGVEKFGMFLIGESFLNVELLEQAIAHVSSLGKFSFLTTNGVQATPENVRRVMEAGLGSLKFSLTTADREQYELVTQRKADLRDRAIANLKAARTIRDTGAFGCELSATWIDFRDEQREAMAAAVEEVRPYLDTIYGLPLYSFGSLAVEGQQSTGMNMPTPGNTGRVASPVPPLPCWLPFHKVHVLHTGKLTLCAFDAGRKDHNWICGDLRHQTFMEVWHSKPAQALRAAHLKQDVRGTVCEKCAAYG